jgi:hypothetical protein
VGVDRIDLAAGHLDFRLTPYIMLGTIFLTYFFTVFIFSQQGRRFHKPEQEYGLLVLILCIVLLISVMQSEDYILSRNRFLLLAFNMLSAYAVMKVLSVRSDSESILTSAAKLGIWIFFIFDIAQGLNFYFGLIPPLGNAVVDIVPPMYGDLAIRPSGFTTDMNLGAFVLVTFFFWIHRYAQPSWIKVAYLTSALTLLALTLSRSGIFALVVMIISGWMYGNYQASILKIVKMTILLVIVGAIIFTLMIFLFDVSNYTVLLEERLSFSSDDSGGIHFQLIKRGLEVFLHHPFFGSGFGASYLDLVDFFEFDHYSNYHSLFITSLAETGLFGFLALMMILLLPLFNRCKAPSYGPLIWSLMTFNIFYQANGAPIFWLILSFAWIYSLVRE